MKRMYRPLRLRKSIIFCFTFFCLWTLGLIGLEKAVPEAAEPKGEKVTMAIPGGTTMSRISFEMAMNQGFYQKEGIETEIVTMKGTLITAALVSGSLDYATSAARTVHTAAAGFPIKLIFVSASARSTYLVGQAGIKSIKEIKGKSIAVSSLAGSEHMATTKALRKYGYDPTRDVTFKDVGPGMKPAVLVSGAADIVFTSFDDALPLRKKGYNLLVRVSDIAPSLSQGLGINEKKLRENRSQVKKVLRATLKGHIFARTKKKEVVDFMVAEWGKDRSTASESYDEDIRYFTPDGTVPMELIDDVIEEGRQVGIRIIPGMTPEKIIDFSLLKEVQKELGL